MPLDSEAERRTRIAVHPRRLILYRHCDGTGVSGTGVVASGVEWPDGHVALRWMADNPDAVSSTSFWTSVAQLLQVHGHRGDSEVVYLDADPAADGGATRPAGCSG